MVEYKPLKIKLSSWNKLRRVFYGRKDETFSDYIERIAKNFDYLKTHGIGAIKIEEVKK